MRNLFNEVGIPVIHFDFEFFVLQLCSLIIIHYFVIILNNTSGYAVWLGSLILISVIRSYIIHIENINAYIRTPFNSFYNMHPLLYNNLLLLTAF